MHEDGEIFIEIVESTDEIKPGIEFDLPPDGNHRHSMQTINAK
jgi:hypothetical protein